MANDPTKLISYENLAAYDTLIKGYIGTEDAKSIKTVLWDSTNEQIKFYKKENATLADTADYSVTISSTDVANLKTRVGMSSSLNSYESATNLTDIMNILTGNSSTTGSVAKIASDEADAAEAAANSYTDSAINGLDVTEFPLAEVSNNVVTIHGISETDGEIAVGASSTNDIVLEEVAYTGAAADVSTTAITDGAVEDPQTLYPAGTAQGTLESIARDLNALESESVVTVEKQLTAETGYFATYVVKQNNTQVGEKINIPKDYLVKSATVETVTVEDEPYEGAEVGDKYIDFTVNVYEGTGTESHIYIPVDDLMAAISGGTTTVANEYELQVSVDAHNVITAALNNIYAQKVQYVPTSQTTVLTNVTTVKGALDAIDTLIQGMDADLDASGTPAHSGVFVMNGVTEANGVITSVDSVEVEPAGAVATAIGALDATPSQSAGTDGLALSLTEVDGVVTAISGSITPGTYYDTTNYIMATDTDINNLFQ